MNNGKLLSITSFQDIQRETRLDSFSCYVSPEAIKIQQANRFNDALAVNGNQPIYAFNSGDKSSMKLNIILDGTGAHAHQNNQRIPVADQLSKLRKNTMEYVGAIHQPPFLTVTWGDLLVFDGRGVNLEVNYKSFNSKQEVVHAEAKLTLVQDTNPQLSERRANMQSPDIFHYHEVAPQENLALISFMYYQDTRHIHLIARENQLNNLYDCHPGTQLLIPPLNQA